MSIIDAIWLKENLPAKEIKVIDSTWHMPSDKRNAYEEYLKEHIKGAVFFDIDENSKKSPFPHMLPDAKTFAKTLEKLGISNDSYIVIYDNSKFMSASRLWWMLRIFGHDKSAILDGGLASWKKIGGEIANGMEKTNTGNFKASFIKDYLYEFEEVKSSIYDHKTQIIDARSAQRFYGLESENRKGMKSGHIPGSINLYYKKLVDENNNLLPRKELSSNFENANIDLRKNTIATCGSGITACFIAYVMHLLGNDKTAVYDGSWCEYSQREKHLINLYTNSSTHKDTNAVHAGRYPENYDGAVNPPLSFASTIIHPSLADLEKASTAQDYKQNAYGRSGTKTIYAFEESVAKFYHAANAIATPSGLAAITAALSAFCKKDKHILIADTVYQPTRRYCQQILTSFGINVEFYDPLIGKDIEKMITEDTVLIFMESPGSLTFEVQDAKAISTVAKEKNVVTILDNSWATGYFHNPFNLGVGIVIESATKYMSGYADNMLGVIIYNQDIYSKLRSFIAKRGDSTSPDACYKGQRGLRTLPVRLNNHQQNARRIIDFLSQNEFIEEIFYPPLKNSPGHSVWKRDFTGASGLFSVVLRQKSHQALAKMLDNMRLFKMGYSWGGFESLILPVYPKLSRNAVEWKRKGVTLRIHAGLENVADLIEDLYLGLKRYADSD